MKQMNLFVLGFCCFLGGCSLVSHTREVNFDIPALPDEIRESSLGVWILEYSSLSGDYNSENLDWSKGIPESFTLSQDKEQVILAILHPPSLVPGLGFRPLAAFADYKDNSAIFSPEAGSPLTLLVDLVHSAVDLSGFNIPRFLMEMGELEDPWNIDREKIQRQIMRHQMRSWYIREEFLHSLESVLPSGLWYASTLGKPPLHSDGINPLALNFPEGHDFLYCPFSGTVGEIQVDSHGEGFWFFHTQRSPASGSFH